MNSFAKRLRKGQIKKNDSVSMYFDLVLVLDNVYDTFNVGGLYRVADAAGVSQIIHTGETPIPPNPKISRAAVGLDQYIKHKQKENIIKAVNELQTSGFKIVTLEQDREAKEYDQVDYIQHLRSGIQDPIKLALVVGNETFGVNEKVLKQSDLVVELPMYGINKSLNVVVATGIVLYYIRRQFETVEVS